MVIKLISKKDKDVLIKCAKKYNVSYLVLFGSSIKKGEEANDIDIGVMGIKPQQFFKFYAELFKHLSKPVDLVDLSQKSLFNELIEENGVRINV